MRVATADAREIAACSADALVLGIYLSEAPIGDEYGCLTPDEWDRAGRWEQMIRGMGIQVWEEQACSKF